MLSHQSWSGSPSSRICPTYQLSPTRHHSPEQLELGWVQLTQQPHLPQQPAYDIEASIQRVGRLDGPRHTGLLMVMALLLVLALLVVMMGLLVMLLLPLARSWGAATL